MKNDIKIRLIQFPEYEVEFIERYNPSIDVYDYYFKTSMSNSYEYAFGVERRFTKQELRNVYLAYDPSEMTEDQWKKFWFED